MLWLLLAVVWGGGTTIELSQDSIELIKGETIRLTATSSSGETIVWETSDASIATVSGGRVTGKGAGTATITASCGDVKKTCTVTVVEVVITLSQTTATIDRGQTLTLTATADREGTINWSSSNEEVVTVNNGVLTAVNEGTAIVTARYGNTQCLAECAVTVGWESKPADYAEVVFGEEATASGDPGNFYYWNDQGWCGSNVTVSQAEYYDGGLHIAYSGVTDACWFGLQIFYKNAANVVGKYYEVSMDITSQAVGQISVCGNVVDLVVGENHVVAYYTETALNSQSLAAASIAIQMGVEGVGVISENTLVIKNLTFTEATSETLKTPTALSIAADGTVTITDTENGSNVKDYTLVFSQSGTTKYSIHVANGGKIDDTIMADGTYDVAIIANGSGKYVSSAASDVLATYTVANGGVKYDMENQGETYAQANPDKYFYWTEFGGIENAKYDNGTVTFDVVNGGNWYSNQIFYKNTSLTNGNKYTLTMDINSTVAGDITINGTVKSLVEGDNHISIEITEGATSISIQMGVNGGVALTSGSFVITNIAWAEVGEQGGAGDGGEQTSNVIANGDEAAAVSKPDTYIEWHDQNWCGSNVTVSKAEYVDGVATVSYSGSNENCWFGMQLFYKNSANVAGTQYTVSFTLTSEYAGTITVNGNLVDLEVGENNISLKYTEPADKASLSIQMGKSGNDGNKGPVLAAENTITIKGLTFVEYVPEQGDSTVEITEGSVDFDLSAATWEGNIEVYTVTPDTDNNSITVTYTGVVGGSYNNINANIASVAGDRNVFTVTATNNGSQTAKLRIDINSEQEENHTSACNVSATMDGNAVTTDTDYGGSIFDIEAGATVQIIINYDPSRVPTNVMLYIDSCMYQDAGSYTGSITLSNASFVGVVEGDE